jgi:Methyltransferase domain
MTEDQIQQFLNDTENVEGWFFPIDASLFGALDEIQKRERITGELFEIGVHHGKSAILLARMLQADESLGVCDVFGQQELNVDHSGEGSRELFLRNLSRHAPAAAVNVFAKRSDQLTAEETMTRCRFVHIDGGHRPTDVVNDLHVAARALLSDGVVVVDDAFNPSWPGVGEGLYDYFASEARAFAPIIIGGNKAYFVRASAIERYRPWLERIATGEFFQSPAFGFEYKDWLGHNVLTASRRDWVDLHPLAAARLHYRGGALRKWLLK